MKPIIISADGEQMAYSVPDEVADHLEEYCIEFCTTWLQTSPHAKKYRKNGYLCYNEADFIDYLNEWIFPEQQSVFLENLGWIGPQSPLPPMYKNCPRFNF